MYLKLLKQCLAQIKCYINLNYYLYLKKKKKTIPKLLSNPSKSEFANLPSVCSGFGNHDRPLDFKWACHLFISLKISPNGPGTEIWDHLMDQNQQLTTGVNSAPPPRPLPPGHTCQLLEKFFTCHTWKCSKKPEMLLNHLQRTGQPPGWRMIRPKTSVELSLEEPWLGLNQCFSNLYAHRKQLPGSLTKVYILTQHI